MQPKTSPRESPPSYKKFNQALASFENIEPAVIGLVSSSEIVYVNDSACDLLGCSKEELEGCAFGAIAPEMTTEVWSSFCTGLDHGNLEQGLSTLHVCGKKKLVVGFRALFMLASGLKYFLIIKPGENLTAGVNVGNLSWPLVHVLNNLRTPVYTVDDHYKITFLNWLACQAFGTTVAQAVGTTVYDYMPKRHADIIWKKQQKVLESMHPIKHIGDGFLRAKYGESAWFLPFIAPGRSQKQLLIIVNTPHLTGYPTPVVTPESHEPIPGQLTSDTASEIHKIMDSGISVGIFLKNINNRYIWVNQAFARIVGFEPKDFIGKFVEDVVSDPEALAKSIQEDDYVYSTGNPLFHIVASRFNNQSGYYRLDKFPFINRKGELAGIIGLVVEIDEPAPPIEALKKELESTSKKLAETETALRVLIERREQDAALSREALNAKVKDLLVPYLENLKQTQLTAEQAEFVELVETNLKHFYDPAYARLSSPTYKLSPTELKVAQLVRDGKTNKEIAKLLHLSKSTILTHRHHVRVKLGIKNKKVNLRSLLNS